MCVYTGLLKVKNVICLRCIMGFSLCQVKHHLRQYWRMRQVMLLQVFDQKVVCCLFIFFIGHGAENMTLSGILFGVFALIDIDLALFLQRVCAARAGMLAKFFNRFRTLVSSRVFPESVNRKQITLGMSPGFTSNYNSLSLACI